VTAYLLDVNVLIALLDPGHVQHEPAHAWFKSHGQKAWATCPLTENAVLRIVGNRRYPNSPGSPAAVALDLAEFCAQPGHESWPDDISLLSSTTFDHARLLSSAQVSDTYLLGLAKAHGGKLATFDKRLVTDAVRGGTRHLHRIGAD